MNESTGFTRAIAINVYPFFYVKPRFLSQILCSFGEISVFFSAKLLCEAKFEIETQLLRCLISWPVLFSLSTLNSC